MKSYASKHKKKHLRPVFSAALILLAVAAIWFMNPTGGNNVFISAWNTESNQKDLVDNHKEKEQQQLEKKVSEKLKTMTLEQKVAQMFMVTPDALVGMDPATTAGPEVKEVLKKSPVGGIVFFSKNIVDPQQLTEMTSNLQNYSKQIAGLPLFLGVDEEGGSVTRFANNSKFSVPAFTEMSEIGKTKDLSQAHQVGKTIGDYLHKYGFNLDFAPDADVLSNPSNQVIGVRSFGSDPKQVADMDMEVAKGLMENQVYACLKHFPGHGATEGDTHKGYAYTDKTLKELQECELIPFQKGIDCKISFLMVSHIAVPQVTKDDTPATVSKKLVGDILRKQMGYNGIVVTDAMNMGAITKEYDSATAATKAITAGVDIILMPDDFSAAYQGVLDAVASGTLKVSRIDKSIRRILRVKLK